MATDCRYLGDLQGDSPWTDWKFRVTARKLLAAKDSVMFESPDGSNYWLNLRLGNKYVAIEKPTSTSNGRHVIGGQRNTPIEDRPVRRPYLGRC